MDVKQFKEMKVLHQQLDDLRRDVERNTNDRKKTQQQVGLMSRISALIREAEATSKA